MVIRAAYKNADNMGASECSVNSLETVRRDCGQQESIQQTECAPELPRLIFLNRPLDSIQTAVKNCWRL